MRSRLSIACRRAIVLTCLIMTLGCSSTTSGYSPATTKTGSTSAGQALATVPRPDHVVVVIEENHAYSDIMGSSSAPYLHALASQGAILSNSYAITHPSEPNYLALFAGSTLGVSDDACPYTFTSANLAQELMQAHDSFGGYAEDLPRVGYTGCSSANYVRKHNPWVNFTNVPAHVNMPLSLFPTDFSSLPTVSIVIPNLQNDMHDGTIEQADAWLKNHMDSYAKWAKTNNSLLIITWDEDNGLNADQIATIFIGQKVKVGTYSESFNHYNVLRTLETMYGLPSIKESANVAPITDIWQEDTATKPTVK